MRRNTDLCSRRLAAHCGGERTQSESTTCDSGPVSTCVGGGVKVVEKWRFEIPEKSWHGFRSWRRFNPVYWPCQVAVEGLRRKGRRKKGFYEPWEENAKHRAGISNRQNSTTFDLTATTCCVYFSDRTLSAIGVVAVCGIATRPSDIPHAKRHRCALPRQPESPEPSTLSASCNSILFILSKVVPS